MRDRSGDDGSGGGGDDDARRGNRPQLRPHPSVRVRPSVRVPRIDGTNWRAIYAQTGASVALTKVTYNV